MRRRLATTAAVLLAAAGVLPAAASADAAAPAAHAVSTTAPSAISPSSPEGTYVPADPVRAFDSRQDLHRPLKPGESVKVRVTSLRGISAASEVEAVVVTLTTTGPTRNGYLSAYPAGASGTGISTLTFAKGETRAVTATVPTGANGSITVHNAGGTSAGTAHAIVDVQGYYRNATQSGKANDYFADYPYRLIDTREGPQLQPFTSYEFGVDASDYPTGTEALALNVTATRAAGPGSLTAYTDYSTGPPLASTLNFVRGATATNNAVVRVIERPENSGPYLGFALYNGSRSTVDAVIDVVGFYATGQNGGLRFVPLGSPRRVLDTRYGTGGARTLGGGETAVVTTPSDLVVRGTTAALVGTLTATRGTAPTFLTAWSTGDDRPDTSNLNALAGQTVSNQSVVATTGGSFDLYNQAGRIDAIYDVAGRFDYPDDSSASPTASARSAHAAGRSSLNPVSAVPRAHRLVATR